MNSPEQNNYIQYITRNGLIKTKSVVFTDNGVNTTFVVKGIIEEFFILAVFQNNLRVFGVGFDDIENNDMLGFLNSDLSDVSLIPENAFMPSENVVTMSYNNKYISDQKYGLTSPQLDSTSGFGSNPSVTEPSIFLNPEAVFLHYYCKTAFPHEDFVIRPFLHHLTFQNPINCYGRNIFFYASTRRAPLAGFVVQMFNKGLGNVEPCLTNFYHVNYEPLPVLFNAISVSNGVNFAGLNVLTSETLYTPIQGWVAVFENSVFEIGG